MTVQQIEPSALPAPARIGQATAVEQSRAVAEVAAAVQVAQMNPRNVVAAVEDMRRACGQLRLAERAFFRFPRAGGAVTGASVHLARELARCWGNFQHGVAELRRDDDAAQSEMIAWAWDVQTNSRASTTFIVPHARDTQQGRKDLTELRDIYENNANNAARRVREMIFGLLPVWFVEEAKTIATETLRAGDGSPVEERARKAVEAFAARFRVRQDRIERRLGAPVNAWTVHDVATLSTIFASLDRGEITVEDEFPTERLTVADVAPKTVEVTLDGESGRFTPSEPRRPTRPVEEAAAALAEQQQRGAEELRREAAEPCSTGTWSRLQARFRDIAEADSGLRWALKGTGQTANRNAVMAAIVGHPVAGPDTLTEAEADRILDELRTDSVQDIVAAALGTPAMDDGSQLDPADQSQEMRAAADVPDPYDGDDPWRQA
jgi:hypothetical protein